MALEEAFPELEKEAARARSKRSPGSGRALDGSSGLIRRALQRARASGTLDPEAAPDKERPAKRARKPQEVVLDVSGRLCRTRRDVLWALGPSDFFQTELEDFASQEPPVLGCPEAAFEELHRAMALAHKDLQAGVRALRGSLEGSHDRALAELLDFLGLGWLHGTPLEVPAGLAGRSTMWIERLKALTSGGVLRHLAGRSLLPHCFEDFPPRRPPEPGAIHVARETQWARSLSREQAVAQVLALPSSPWSHEAGGIGPKGCYQPNTLRDGDRLVFDVGPGRFLQLRGLALGLSAMERADEEVRLQLEVAGGPKAGAPLELSGKVRHREHGFAADSAGGWTMAPQTCSVLLLEVEGSPLVARMFAVSCKVPTGGTLGLYHAELFGRLLEAPAELQAACGSAKSFAFDHTSSLHCCQSQDRFYPEELAFLRPYGLLDPALEGELEELEWQDAEAGQDYDDYGF